MQSKRKANEARWASLIREAEASGISAAQFCRNRDISPESFYAWRQRLKKELKPLPEPRAFARVEVVDTELAKLPDAKWVAEFLHHLLGR